MERVEDFFHQIAPKIIALTKKKFEVNTKVIYHMEGSPDLATEGDLENEELIKREITKWFPDDGIIAEETLSDESDIESGRKWIIDPICGSANFKNGVKFFCTNIALAQEGKLIASCVVDHSREEYIWSVGKGEIHIGNRLVSPEKNPKAIVVDVDLSALMSVSYDRIDRQEKLIDHMLKTKKYYLSAFNSSLPFAYVGLGRLSAYVSGSYKVWDVAAPNFLIMQNGIVTEIDGSPWTLKSDNGIGTINKNLHKELLSAINA